MELGSFSVSLAVKDIAASQRFYEQLGFVTFLGDASQNSLVLKNGPTVIGLFQGMFEKNTQTFPGWDGDANALDAFTDGREIQRTLKAAGVEFLSQADETGTVPGSFMLPDPDGNPVLFDQHV